MNHDSDLTDDWPSGGRTVRHHGWPYWYRTIDLRLTKQFRVAGDVVTAIADLYDAPNWANHSEYQSNQSLTAFGAPVADFGRRQAQFGVRWDF